MPEISEYKGNKLICLNPGSKFTFSFGLIKAKMIIKNLKGLVRNVLFHNNSWTTVYYSICSSKLAPKSASGQPTETTRYPEYF